MADVLEDFMHIISLDTEDIEREVLMDEETIREGRSDDDLSLVGNSGGSIIKMRSKM